MKTKAKPLEDYTGQGLLESAYSYEIPSALLANGIMNGLIQSGWTEQEAINWIYSKNYRWSLDFGLAQAIEKLGLEVGRNAAKEYRASTFDYELPVDAKANLAIRNQIVNSHNFI